MTARAGSFVSLGRVKGALAATDPTERYLAVRAPRERCVVYDTHDLARPCDSLPWSGGIAFVEPATHSLVARTATGTILRRGPGRARAASPVALGEDAWVAGTADGAHVLAGDVAPDGHARLTLLDARSLAPRDVVTELHDCYLGERLHDWGAGLAVARAPAPSSAVGLVANVGDDIVVCAVCEVRDGRLATRGFAGDALDQKIPGECCLGALLDDEALYVVDSDQMVSAVPWRGDPAQTRRLASGYALFQGDDDAPTPLAMALARGTDDLRLLLNGPLARVGDRLLVTVEQEVRRDGYFAWEPRGLLVFDVPSARLEGWIEAPGDAGGALRLLAGGVLARTIGRETHVWRWEPPGG